MKKFILTHEGKIVEGDMGTPHHCLGEYEYKGIVKDGCVYFSSETIPDMERMRCVARELGCKRIGAYKTEVGRRHYVRHFIDLFDV